MTGEGPRLHPTWATPAPERDQVLVRLVRPGGGWFRPARYGLAHHPHGRTAPAAWVRETARLTDIPGPTHTTDLHDLQVLLREAWAADAGSWVAWPVHRGR